MNKERNIELDIILAKLGYAISCLSSFNLLDLSKRTLNLHKQLELLKKTYIENKANFDIRDVIKLRDELNEFEKIHNLDNELISLKGHKVACLFFEVSSLISLFSIKFETNEDNKELLETVSKYLYDCGKIINIEIIYYKEKL